MPNNSPKVNKQLLEKVKISFFQFLDGLKMTSHDTQTYPQHGQTILKQNIMFVIFRSYVIITYDIITYDIISSDIISYDIISYDIISYDIMRYDMISYDMISYDMISYVML